MYLTTTSNKRRMVSATISFAPPRYVVVTIHEPPEPPGDRRARSFAPSPRQLIRVRDQDVELPEGVSVSDWALERVRDQNPRIRTFLGCTRLLSEVYESNYAILHCSPDRLLEIWRRVRRVATILRNELIPLLEAPSCIPALEGARSRAFDSLRLLDGLVLEPIDAYDDTLARDQVAPVRRLLCVSLGKLNTYLQNAFGDLVANDPRSLFDADYYISRRFPKDVEEAEWLQQTVLRFRDELDRLGSNRDQALEPVIEQLHRHRRLPEERLWQPVALLLERLLEELTPRLTEIIALRGIRYSELEVLERYATEIPTLCRLAGELYATGRESMTTQRANGAPRHARQALHAVFSRHLLARLDDIDAHVRDLLTFLPLWQRSLEQRRALLLHSPTPGPARSPRTVSDEDATPRR